MASSTQMKSLLNSQYMGDEEHFNIFALQIVAAEVMQGCQKFSDEAFKYNYFNHILNLGY
jgi:hypothetical protein